MHSQRRSLSAALDMVEAAISSLENQAKQAKEYEEQQQQQLLQSRLNPALQSTAPNHSSAKEPKAINPLLDRPMDQQESQLPVTNNTISTDQARLTHPENFNKKDSNKMISYKVLGSSPHKKRKSGKELRAVLPGVLLQQRSSTPRKRSSHKRSGGTSRSKQHSDRNRQTSSPVTTERNNNSIIQADDKVDAAAAAGQDLKSSSGKQHKSGYQQPTLSSKRREQLTDKPKKKDKPSLPFVPVGSQGKSYHVGVIIQKELGKLKSQPLEVWAAAKHNAAKKEAAAAPYAHLTGLEKD